MDDELHLRLADLATALDEYDADMQATWQIGVLYNALLAETQRSIPDDPIVQALQPVAEAEDEGLATSDYGSLRASVRQLENALLSR